MRRSKPELAVRLNLVFIIGIKAGAGVAGQAVHPAPILARANFQSTIVKRWLHLIVDIVVATKDIFTRH